MLKGTKERFIHSKNVSRTTYQKWPQQCFQAHIFFQNIALPIKRQSLFPLPMSLCQCLVDRILRKGCHRLGLKRQYGLAWLSPGCSILEPSHLVVRSQTQRGSHVGAVWLTATEISAVSERGSVDPGVSQLWSRPSEH